MNKHLSTVQQRGGRRLLVWAAPFAVLGLTLALAACEVEWGGIEVKVGEPEFGQPPEFETPTDTVTEEPPLNLPVGPIAFHVRRLDASGRATIEPIAELTDGQLRPVGPERGERAEEYASEFVARYYEPGVAYTLNRAGSRVGTFYVRSPAVTGSDVCLELRADGQIELRPAADTLSEFLAWPEGVRVGEGQLVVPGSREDMITLAQVLARRGVTEGGIEGAWRFQNPADLRALQVGSGRLGFSATFMVRDSLQVASPSDSAGTVFLVADYDPSIGFFNLYHHAEWYAPGGKRALRWLDMADLIGDESSEWVLRAYGDYTSWYEVLGRSGETMSEAWSSRRPICEAQEASGVDDRS